MQLDKGELFYRASIREPGSAREKILTRKANRALAERMATREAERLGWEWIIEHCQAVPAEAGDLVVVVLERRSSTGTHEIFRRPLDFSGSPILSDSI